MVVNGRNRRPDVTGVELVGGPEPLVVGLNPYDEGWPAAFEGHRRRIMTALEGRVVAVEHIGSTAVPGLAAKPIVDLVVVVREGRTKRHFLNPVPIEQVAGRWISRYAARFTAALVDLERVATATTKEHE